LSESQNVNNLRKQPSWLKEEKQIHKEIAPAGVILEKGNA
jgi:hypothetical protein